MGNCLVTKLKDSVSNSELSKLGILNVKRVAVENETSDDAKFIVPKRDLPSDKSYTITIVGDGYFKSSYEGENIGKTLTIKKASSNSVYYTSNGNYDIEIKQKYGYVITQLSNAYQCKIADTYWTGITVIASNAYYGNLSDANPDNIITIVISEISAAKVTFNSSDIGKFVNLTHIGFAPSSNMPIINTSDLGKLINLTGSNQLPNVNGSVEEFVQTQRGNGRTAFNGDLNLTMLGNSGRVTFDGSAITNTTNGVLTWTANTITFRGVTINDSGLIAPSTATVQQIAEWKNSGYTVYDEDGNIL